jgi:hypothetical protein
MENKSCDNCFLDTWPRMCGHLNNNYKLCDCYKPNYPTLESQFSTANLLIKEQIEEICGLKSQLSTANREIVGYREALLEAVEILNYHKIIYYSKGIRQALSRPTPIDDEKEVKECPIYGTIISCGYCQLCNNQAQLKIEVVK